MAKLMDGFIKASHDELPTVTGYMVIEYFSTNPLYSSVENSNVKMNRSSKPQYGDSAIGRVQLKRDKNICTIWAGICPEHKIRGHLYSVSTEIDEKKEKIISAICKDCIAAKGGCKHVVALLQWLHRRSEEPSCTESAPYWSKPSLAVIDTSKPVDSNPDEVVDAPENVLQDFINWAEETNDVSSASRHYGNMSLPFENLNIRQIMIKFLNARDGSNKDALSFRNFCKTKMKLDVCQKLVLNTTNQSHNPVWYEMRYLRVTASKAYEVAQCKTTDGSLVKDLFGLTKFKGSVATRRGQRLEKQVIFEVNKQFKKKFVPTGLYLSPEDPIFGASPDGISSDEILEIKCPFNSKNVENYIKNNVICPKFKAQMQLQMHFTKKTKGIFAIADPDFEKNKKLYIHNVKYDENYVSNIMNKGVSFWDKNIYPKLKASLR